MKPINRVLQHQSRQERMFYDACRKAGRANEHFMELVRNDDITNEELKKLIEKRPSVWGRFSGFVGKLKR